MIKRGKEINIAGKKVGENCPIFIVAEIGINHNGDLELAKKTIDAAATAGADAVKFQTFFVEEENTKETQKVAYQKIGEKDTESFIEMIKKYEFGEKEFRILINYCHGKRIIFFSTPSEEKSARFLNKLGVPVFKIASNDMVTTPMLEEVASFGKPIILSSGMSALFEIREALEAIRNQDNDQIVLLHCTSNYPCALKDVNLLAMQAMGKELDILTGYSDHTQGIEASVMAAGLGACLIEKHFTLDKNLSGPDHKASLDPSEFKKMVIAIRNIEKMNSVQKEKALMKIKNFSKIMGSPEKRILESEKEMMLMCRKGIVSRHNIKKGEILTLRDIAFKRPAFGLPPKFYKQVVGRRVSADISVDGFIKLTDLAKKIVYVTGTRAEYGVMKLLLDKMAGSGFFDVSLLVTGAHLSRKFGHTIDEIKNDGFKIAGIINMKIEDGTNTGMANSMGLGIIGMAKKLSLVKPDLVILTGDRDETLAAAISAKHLNIPIAHISGGDTTRGAVIDEGNRHAITHFADIHFPETENSAKKIIAMRGSNQNVFMVGNPGLISSRSLDEKREKYISRTYHLNLKKPFLLVIQHSLVSQSWKAREQMRETMAAIKELKMQTIVIYPNADAGRDGIIEVINENRSLEFLRIFKNIKHGDFTDLMVLAGAMAGNSSCALTEALSFRLPAVNIGQRQTGRQKGNNIIDVGYDRTEIAGAIRKALSPEFRKKISKRNPYAFPGTEEKIMNILRYSDIYFKNRLNESV